MPALETTTWAAPLRRSGRGLLLFARAQPLGALALVAILLMLVAGVFARLIAPADPVAIDFTAVLSPPSAAHPFGTDNFGRDILSRIIYGARTALIIGFTSSFLGCTLGTLLGVVSAFYGGRVDLAMQRFVDMLLSFPIILLALVVVALLGRHLVVGLDVNPLFAIPLSITPQVPHLLPPPALPIPPPASIHAAPHPR